MYAKKELKSKIAKYSELMPPALEDNEAELLCKTPDGECTPITVLEGIEAAFQKALTLSSNKSNCSDEDSALHRSH